MIWYNEGRVFVVKDFNFCLRCVHDPWADLYGMVHGAWYMEPEADENGMQDKNRQDDEVSPVTE